MLKIIHGGCNVSKALHGINRVVYLDFDTVVEVKIKIDTALDAVGLSLESQKTEAILLAACPKARSRCEEG